MGRGMTPAETHNALAREFVERAGRETKSFGDLMVLIESTLVAAMLLNTRLHGLEPHVSAGLVEAAVQRAIERFTAQMRTR
jgi:hypothetical protein